MLVIDTYLDKSSIEGIGVFAAEDIPKGTILWEFNPLFDSIIREDEITDLPRHIQKWLYYHSWQDADGHYRVGIDNDKFINHSLDPNSRFSKESYTWAALRDIKKGEELTEDYTEFSESDYARNLKKGDTYDPSGDRFINE